MENLLVSYSKCIFLDHYNLELLMTTAAEKPITVKIEEDYSITFTQTDGSELKQPERLLSNLIDETVLYIIYNPKAMKKTGDAFVIIYC